MKILILGDRNKPTLKFIHDFFVNEVKADVIWLDLSNIINELEIDDFITERGKVSICWKIWDEVITPENVILVLNDFQFLPKALFSDFLVEDQEYVRAEYAAYLMFSLSQFSNVFNPPYGGSISGFCRSLPYQWLLIKSFTNKIMVPRFHFGIANETPADIALNYNTVISNNIYDGKYWITNNKLDIDKHSPRLFYIRPKGRPIVIQSLDNNIWGFDISSSDTFSISSNKNIVELITFLSSHFNLRAMEILTFYDKETERFTFGSIQPFIEIELLSDSQKKELLKVLRKYANKKT